jgi:hypothetical protein
MRPRYEELGFTTIAEDHGAVRRREGPLSWTLRLRDHDAQAELLVESPDRALNAAIYGRLLARQSDIEAAVGRSLTWDDKP